MKFNYLVMVNPGANNNKYYKMTEVNGQLVVEYGRVGSNPSRAYYDMAQWNKKYNEKIRKGYVDQTNLHLDMGGVQSSSISIDKNQKRYKSIKDESIRNLINNLQHWAKDVVKRNYTIKSHDVTPLMVKIAQEYIDALISHLSDKTTYDFNEILISLYAAIPRKMSDVSSFMAHSTTDFVKIIEHEQGLLDVMRGQVDLAKYEENDITTDDVSNETILDAFGIEMKPVTNKEKDQIIRHLGVESHLYSDAWKVVNKKTQKTFDEYLSRNDKPKVKLFWHGSKNENWWSILRTGLLLRPNATITGKMFGYGLYFAPKSTKSLGYTSLNGSYWARGSQDKAYMALMAVAYGTPYKTANYLNSFGSLTYDKLKALDAKANCLHALKGNNLRNDEIIIYREDQCTIKYFVELIK